MIHEKNVFGFSPAIATGVSLLEPVCQVPEPYSHAADNEKVASAALNARRDVSYSGHHGGSAFGSRGIEVRSFLWV
jgi:hypothetical protein